MYAIRCHFYVAVYFDINIYSTEIVIFEKEKNHCTKLIHSFINSSMLLSFNKDSLSAYSGLDTVLGAKTSGKLLRFPPHYNQLLKMKL